MLLSALLHRVALLMSVWVAVCVWLADATSMGRWVVATSMGRWVVATSMGRWVVAVHS